MMKKSLNKIILVNLIVVAVIVAFIVGRNTQKAGNNEVKTNEIQNKTEEVISVSSDPSDTTETIVVPGSSTTVVAPGSPAKIVPDNRCIITINGKKYNVTDYKNRHPGGDIFTCGIDMTSIFNNQHGSSTLKKMAPYLVN
jgi:cytochrome b involved in lipid metabolism